MLPLQGSSFPTTAEQLRTALDSGVRQLGLAPREILIEEEAFPRLRLLKVDLSGSSVASRPPAVKPTTARGGELHADVFELLAKPITIGPAPIHLSLSATNAVFREFAAENADALLALRSGEGRLELEIGHEDLRQLLLFVGREAARERGADVTDLQLSLHATSPRALEFQSEVTAKFGFIKTTLTLTGRATLDDALQLRLSDLDLKGSGMAAGLATGFIRPQLEKFQREPISLSALPLGDLRLRDVRLSTAKSQLRVEAEFGG
jgi:hypothetical protein